MDHKRTTNAFVGSPVERIEDLRFLRGRGQFVDDLARADLLHAVILRSPVAHGRIRSIDTSAALARPGVHAVITAADIGAVSRRSRCGRNRSPAFKPFEQPVIAHDKVRYVGEPVAVVLADERGGRRGRARRDRARHRAAAGGRGRAPPRQERRPAVRGGRQQSRAHADRRARRCRRRVRDARPMSGASASRCSATARCRWSRAGCWPNGTRRWAGSPCPAPPRSPFLNRRMLAKHMGLPESAIRMVENDVGGGFGARGEFYPEDFLIPFAARSTGRPVKWIEDRREHLTRHQPRPRCRMRAGDRLRPRRHHPGAARPRRVPTRAPISAPTARPRRATSRRC